MSVEKVVVRGENDAGEKGSEFYRETGEKVKEEKGRSSIGR
jgi:hypothetical protein